MSTSNVSYPLMPEWSTAEIIAMSAFYAAVEDLNTVGIKRDEFMEHYHHFLAIEPAKAAQKQLDKAFEKLSEVSQGVFAKIYQQANPNAGADQGAGAGADGGEFHQS